MMLTGKDAAARIRNIANELDEISSIGTSSISFAFSELSNEAEALKKLDKLKLKKRLSIYSFHLEPNVNRDFLLEKMDAAKSGNKDRAIARTNKPKHELSTDCFYVGTSRDTFKRINEHLGYGHPKTYSLQLCHWATEIPGRFKIIIRKFELGDNERQLLTYLEDQLAYEQSPMFGRRGNL